MAEPVTLTFAGFRPEAVEKVMRLLMLLDLINSHSFLKTRICLHGGTALNLFVLGAPRLSVDIDLNYIGSTDRSTMLAERPAVEQAVMDVGREMGFSVLANKAEHSGRSFRLGYQAERGSDQVKIDVDYLNRSPLLPVKTRTVVLESGVEVSFPLNSDIELFAGKSKALLERVAVRDLYDVGTISATYPTMFTNEDKQLTRRIFLYYLSISGPFPRPLQVASRFTGHDRELGEALYPMLSFSDRPALPAMIETAESFVRAVFQPTDDAEAEYLARAARADFAPDLLFADYPDTLAAAQADPSAAWKMQNLAAVA